MPKSFGREIRQLPPLILHPFARQAAPAQFADQVRAALMLNGALDGDGRTPDELSRRVVEARLQELRMLYYLGKDLFRWMEQCVEWTAGAGLEQAGLREQSFAAMLVRRPPQAVSAKLKSWGVAEHGAIFARAIGLKAVFREPPDLALLEPDFLINYHRYADYLFECYEQAQPSPEIAAEEFTFELYGSGEYSRLLESQWGTG